MHREHVKRLFEVLFGVLVLVLVYTVFFNRSLFADILFMILIVVGLRWYGHGKLGCWTVTAMMAAIFAHVAGAFGLYGHFAAGVIGYDKIVHLISGIAIGLFVLEESAEPMPRRVILALLIVLGAGAFTELSEFVGTRYFGVNNGGVFTISDGLPIVSDFQSYDTYFDLITDLVGGVIAALVWFVQRETRPRRKK